ncbi:APC family permease [Alicyclobacillus fastidiosus]|uniref:APC family permease n=1 Tax=Alicyclobacillus fastidiosus TaxID=392011 RepID=A0ABY6ZC72_9BACL|nr:APC family permease [Alicyclobacillus fastidiosus]WAH40489.1 APC family permease [Alicyclobacillus fastidiosus]GMA61904.1 aspartate:proton symporter [Alicyclobacillus fastidiosus]
MAGQGKFKRQLSLIDLVFIGFGSIFGSGWLFASSHVASIAGPAGWISWVIAGIAVILLGLVYAELGGSIPRAGGVVRYPAYSHGPLVGFLTSFATLIAFTSLIAIEIEAARQYATSWLPTLTVAGSSGSPTVFGWFFQFALLLFFFLLNYWSVKTFAKSNTIISILKFIVPTLTIVFLLIHLKGANFHVQGFSPYGFTGIESAISTGGVIFAYLGLQPIVGFATEAKNPQRTVPIAIIVSIVLSTIVYVLLQVAFTGSIPTHMLSGGWSHVGSQFTLPYRDIAVVLGLGWLAILVTLDAIVSPSGTGNIYMSSTPRMIFGWSRTGTLFKLFARVDERTGIPRPALWLTFAMSIFWTLPFPSWGALIGVVSSALVFTYAIAPISAHSFRKNAPDISRPFYLKGMSVIGPISFVIASLIVYWTGWNTDSWLLGVQFLMFILYLIFRKFVPTKQVSFAQQLKSCLWLVFYYVMMIILSYLGTFDGGRNVLRTPWDQVAVCIVSLITYYWGVNTGLPTAIFDEDAVETTTLHDMGGQSPTIHG